jgi:tRNA modification GTPase
MFSTSDTIVAIATPAGRGGIGVVRLSGSDAAAIARSLVGGTVALEPRRATFTRILPRDSEPAKAAATDDPRPVDQVVVTWFAGPKSYTGEDVVEISGHGSPLLLQRIVELAMRAGARLAEPGEFTLRAYLNGRLDLVQAEAVSDLVNAVTPLQARVAMDQLEGTLTKAIGEVDEALFDLSARLEASLDFPDEGFHFITRDEVRQQLGRLQTMIAELAAQGRAGRVVREGSLVVIVGRPNVGKSSLFNALAGAARAIVTEIPGTTRDVLTERVDISGLPITLIDTAGMRETTDVIESEGVARAKQARDIAALSLIVLDGSAPLCDDDRRLARVGSTPTLVVISKTDLPRAWLPRELDLADESFVEISVLTGDGLDKLRDRIAAMLSGREEMRDPPRISNVRHLALIDTAAASLRLADEAIAAGATEELVLVDLTAARAALEEITGRRTTDDLLHHIFSTFCVGK